MKLAETLTFGGSGLDRAAALRDRPGDLAAALADGGDRVLAVWRGKPLCSGPPEAAALAWLPEGHPVLGRAGADRVFLGDDDGTWRFAADISAWEPANVDEAQIGAMFDPSVQVHPAAADGQAFRELRGVMTALGRRDAELAATAKALLGWHRTHRFCSRCGAESAMAQAGWQRVCPACGGHHFPRTDPVVIMLITHGNDVLVGRSPGWPEGMYSLLAGFVEPGETFEAAVRRETFEEAGVTVGRVHYLSSQPWPYPASLMIGCRGEALNRDITLDPAEIDDARWLSREAAVEALGGRHEAVKPARRGAIARFLIEMWLADRLD